jgi:hypothetical protein
MLVAIRKSQLAVRKKNSKKLHVKMLMKLTPGRQSQHQDDMSVAPMGLAKSKFDQLGLYHICGQAPTY